MLKIPMLSTIEMLKHVLKALKNKPMGHNIIALIIKFIELINL